MTEVDRIACCIVGCRRTFRNKDVRHHAEYMCGKHYRADPDLVRFRKRIEFRARRLLRALNKKHTAGQLSAERCEAIWSRIQDRLDGLWTAIKANAQTMQDTGYWAARPRQKHAIPKPSASDQLDSRRNSKFEDQFQRIKRGMQEARS